MKNFKWQWIVKGLFFGALFVLVFVGGTMWLWNHLAVELFGAPTLNFAETLGLMILGRLITGGFKGGHWGHKPEWGGGPMMRHKWNKMTAEQREQYKQRWKDCSATYWKKEEPTENTAPPAE